MPENTRQHSQLDPHSRTVNDILQEVVQHDKNIQQLAIFTSIDGRNANSAQHLVHRIETISKTGPTQEGSEKKYIRRTKLGEVNRTETLRRHQFLFHDHRHDIYKA